MLRINLLPIRQLKKRAKAKNQILSFLLLFCVFCGGLFLIGWIQLGEIKEVQASIAQLQQEKRKLDPIIREVDELERQQKDLKNKIDVIKKLRKESSLTVHVLDEVANRVDSERMWLTTLSQQGGQLQLKGVALDNQTIAQFMETLKLSEYVQDVSLTSSTLKKVSNRNFKSFALSCSVTFPENETDETAALNKSDG